MVEGCQRRPLLEGAARPRCAAARVHLVHQRPRTGHPCAAGGGDGRGGHRGGGARLGAHATEGPALLRPCIRPPDRHRGHRRTGRFRRGGGAALLLPAADVGRCRTHRAGRPQHQGRCSRRRGVALQRPVPALPGVHLRHRETEWRGASCVRVRPDALPVGLHRADIPRHI